MPSRRPRPFQQLDVFSDRAGFGNPLAVVLDGEGLDDAAMQRFARWTNLSETTFVLPSSDAAADYRVRIFTPGEPGPRGWAAPSRPPEGAQKTWGGPAFSELPFAGHPTLGTCHAWLRAGGRPRTPGRVLQQCGIGLVEIRIEERLAFAAPPLRRSAPSPMQLAQAARALGLHAAQVAAAQLLDNGPVWLGLLLHDADTVLSLRPDHRALRELGLKVGVAALTASAASEATGASPLLIGRSNREARAFAGSHGAARPAASPQEPALEVRAFAAAIGVDEDPVTGSLHASLGQWLIAEGHLPARYLAGQGQCLGRDGRVQVERDADGQVWIGGDVADCIEGTVLL